MNLEEGQEYMSTETKRIALQEYDKVVDVLFNNARRQIGLCTNNLNGKSTIKYSNRIIEKHEKDVLINLIIHEVVHIKQPNHRRLFKDECKRLGKKLGIIFNDSSYKKMHLNEYNYIYRCDMCGYKVGRVRPLIVKSYHSACCKKLKQEKIMSLEKAELISI